MTSHNHRQLKPQQTLPVALVLDALAALVIGRGIFVVVAFRTARSGGASNRRSVGQELKTELRWIRDFAP
jgi:hypothetical protein